MFKSLKSSIINFLAGYNVDKAITSLKKEIENKEEALSASSQSLCKSKKNFDLELSAANNKNTELLSLISSKDEDLNTLHNSIENAKGCISILTAEKKTLEQKCLDLQNVIESNKTNLLELNVLLNKKEQECHDLFEKNNCLKSDINNLKEEKDYLLSKVSELENLVSIKNDEITEIRNSTNERINQLEQEKASLLNKINELMAALQSALKKHEEVKKLPEIKNEITKGIKRSILSVEDTFTHKTLTSTEIFETYSITQLSYLYRRLLLADKIGQTYFVCSNCKQPVKILKIDRNGQENMRFVHCKNEPYCSWRPEITQVYTSDKNILPFGDEERLQYIKDTIGLILSSTESKNKGITEVSVDYKLHSTDSNKSWRTVDISLKLNDSPIGIQLQRRKDTNTYIIDRDKFFIDNCYPNVWIFGAESGSSYDYLRGSNFKSTLFASHRNIFIFDEEAESESLRRKEIVLKCNWLDENDKWHYNDDNCNGILVSLDQLSMDNKTYRLFYYDANKEYFKTHPEEEIEWKDVDDKLLENEHTTHTTNETSSNEIISENSSFRDNKIKQIVDNVSAGDDDDRKKQLDLIIIAPGFGKLLYNGSYLLSDDKGLILSSRRFADIEHFHDDYFKAKNTENLWCIINKKGVPLCSYKYTYIEVYKGKYADATRVPSVKTRINEIGEEINQSEVELKDGYCKYKFAGQWGLKKGTNTIVIAQYDEIASLNNRIVYLKSGELIESDIRYDYPIGISGDIKSMDGNSATIRIGKSEYNFILHKISRETPNIGTYTNNFILLSKNQSTTIIGFVSAKSLYGKKFISCETERSIETGKVMGLKVVKNIRKGLHDYQYFEESSLIMMTYDQVVTIVPASSFKTSGLDINAFKPGNILQMEKIGFNQDRHYSEWKIIKKY